MRRIKILLVLLLVVNITHSQTKMKLSGLIAHACGVIDGYKYTNSKEALMRLIELGYKYIELDLVQTTDGHIVLAHDWTTFNAWMTDNEERGDSAMALSDFKKEKVYGLYTTMSLDDALDILRNYPEIVIVTDKISTPEIIDKYFSEFKNRLLIEAFKLNDYNELKRMGYVPMYSRISFEAFASSVENLIEGRSPIDFIATSTMEEELENLKRLRCISDFNVAIYTSNDEKYIDSHLGNEVDLIYTDDIMP